MGCSQSCCCTWEQFEVGSIRALVTLLILVPYFTGVPFIVWRLFANDPFWMWAHTLFATVVIAWSVTVYWRACLLPPGTPSADWRPTKKHLYIDYGAGKPKTECKVCEAYLPPRARHCTDCKRCVYRFDHHCPWIGQCVGHGNHKAFIQFLFYCTSAIGYLLVLICLRAYQLYQMSRVMFGRSRFRLNPSDTIILMLLGTLYIALFIAIGALLCWQLYLISLNQTGLENYKFSFYKDKEMRENKKRLYFPYDLGRIQNIKSIMGYSFLDWFLPTPTPGDGVFYPVSTRFAVDLEQADDTQVSSVVI